MSDLHLEKKTNEALRLRNRAVSPLMVRGVKPGSLLRKLGLGLLWLVGALASFTVVIENIRYIETTGSTMRALGSDDWWMYPVFIIIVQTALGVYCLYQVLRIAVKNVRKNND